MTETLIQAAEWQAFCERFTRTHRGWLVTVTKDARQPGGEPVIVLDNEPLQAVRLHREGSDVSISIAAGKEKGQETCAIQRVAVLGVHRTEDGADERLIVRSADGEVTGVRILTPHFNPAKRPR